MKKAIKLMIMLLCAASITALSSCTKDENTDTTNNGLSDRDNPTENAPRGYTMGYYHPEKKIKKISYSNYIYSEEDPYYNSYAPYYGDSTDFHIMAEFTWDGNNLKSITTDSDVYECQYDSLGYISSWNWGNNKQYRFSYYTTESWSGSNLIQETNTGWCFDDNGILTGVDGDEVTMANGNAVKIVDDFHYGYGNGNYTGTRTYYDTLSYSYDNKKNPFVNLLIPDLDSLNVLQLVTDFRCFTNVYDRYGYDLIYYNYCEDYLFRISKNNLIPRNDQCESHGVTIKFKVEYSSDGWPVKWVGRFWQINDDGEITYEVNTVVVDYYE